MNPIPFLLSLDMLWSPVGFATLAALTVLCVWLAFLPTRKVKSVDGRLEDYLQRTGGADIVEELEMQRSIVSRVVLPGLRKVLHFIGALGPQRNIAAIQQLLTAAGDPGGLTALDFLGLQLLLAVVLGGAVGLLLSTRAPLAIALRNGLIAATIGFLGPYIWLRGRASSRQQEIERALPDALDMLTIGVEAGLGFESALLRVSEQWDNALTREFRRGVVEMRLGTPRDVAMQRIAERAGVQALATFVAVFIQSTQLGVSVANVLHSQAAQLRTVRRQRAEELARQAGVKMVFPLVFMIFPALLVVLLGPGLPSLLQAVSGLSGGIGTLP